MLLQFLNSLATGWSKSTPPAYLIPEKQAQQQQQQ